MPEFHRVASVGDVAPGSGIETAAGGRVIALYNIDGEFHAMDGVCAHAGGPLGKGIVAGNVVTCPWHGWQFDATTGHHCLNSNIRQATFVVKVEGSDVFVQIPRADD
ncbi:MAG: Rieske 2Fe-2S domain-containing protein [Planctomycetota bacterium]|nr:Rieske 2Fe-2S domain-containing protein [Planctomycetota bacterium]